MREVRDSDNSSTLTPSTVRAEMTIIIPYEFDGSILSSAAIKRGSSIIQRFRVRSG